MKQRLVILWNHAVNGLVYWCIGGTAAACWLAYPSRVSIAYVVFLALIAYSVLIQVRDRYWKRQWRRSYATHLSMAPVDPTELPHILSQVKHAGFLLVHTDPAKKQMGVILRYFRERHKARAAAVGWWIPMLRDLAQAGDVVILDNVTGEVLERLPIWEVQDLAISG